ncbi:MAG: ATP-binding protein [Lachnospiraceae bacterium]|nr:ATP-binding protein [Lachnospiraceae bacterium]
MDFRLALCYDVRPNDFRRAGEASTDLKMRLQGLHLAPDIVRRAAIAMYEGEINMVIHAEGGVITVTVTDGEIRMVFEDKGPGIPDIDKAMQAGYSTASEMVRNMGFGAGMGLPNMKQYSDDIQIESKEGIGTTVTMRIFLPEEGTPS